jgi:cytidine deaminase
MTEQLTSATAGAQLLAQAAWDVRQRAYAPYSRFAVGAAIRTRTGRIFTGCNVENVSFGLTMCAERVAIGNAIAAGEREFDAICIVAESAEPVSPCGACRQVLAEFGSGLIVTSLNSAGGSYEAAIEQLLPRAKTGILG